MIEISGVSQVFQTSGRQSHLALSNISLTIQDGAFVSILGPSGCGKSTLLYIVGGFVTPSQGVAKVKGKAITGPGPDRGPVFQEFALFPWKSVLGNVMYGPRQQGVKPAEAEAQSRRLIEMVGLKGFEHFYPKELSGGMKQRVALARTLAYHPAVLLMDEPLARWMRIPGRGCRTTCLISGNVIARRYCSLPTRSRKRCFCPTRSLS